MYRRTTTDRGRLSDPNGRSAPPRRASAPLQEQRRNHSGLRRCGDRVLDVGGRLCLALHLLDGRWHWRGQPPGWVETRYEAKARSHGRKPAYLRFTRLA